MHKIFRVVIDTNHIMSAILSARGASAKLIEWITREEDYLMRLDVCTDPSDNCFLECAVAGGADYLVTKNIRHFPPKEYAGIKIVRIRAFLRALEQTVRRNPQTRDHG